MKLVSSVTGALLLAVCSDALARPHVDAAGHLIRDTHSCGTTKMPHPVAVATPFASPGRRTVVLNRFGGMYNIASGATNAATNAVSTIASGDGRPHMNAVIPPLEASFDWPYIVECVKKQYKPYNVIITETEPTSGNYIEAVVGGDGSSMGWGKGSGILGVAAADNFCGVTEKGIAFNFSSNHLGIQKANDELCVTIAHEIGHLLALEHEIAPTDSMSYIPFSRAGQKSFTTPSSQCGTSAQETRPCSCPTTGPGQVTSSAMRLTQHVGTRPIETVPPTLEVITPGNDNTVRPKFAVTATANDETAMEQVTVSLDGKMVGSSSMPEGTTYTIPLADVAEGPHALEVAATDLAGNVTKKQLSIKVALGATGESCTAPDDCRGNVCAINADGSNFCSQACSAENACPDGFACETASNQQICVPSEDGGCSVGGGTHSLALLLLGTCAWLARRRRPRA